MINFKSSFVESFIGHILELSAQAQIERRKMEKSSPAFQRLSGTVLAYGNVLALLTAFREMEELEALLGQTNPQDCALAMTH